MKFAQKELHNFREDIGGLFRFAAEQGIEAVQIHLPSSDRVVDIKAAMQETGVLVASVNAMSCAMLGPDKEQQAHEHRQVKKALAIADDLGAPTVTNCAGFDYTKSLEENAEEFARVYAGHAEEAEQRGLKICFENCPMYGGMPQRAQNMAYCPAHWRLLFEALPSDAIGLELDVAHTVYVGLDAVRLLHEWQEKIFHVQIKDAQLQPERQAESGLINGIPHSLCPLGQGALNGEEIFQALADIDYDGYVTSDIEGFNIEGAKENIAEMKRCRDVLQESIHAI